MMIINAGIKQHTKGNIEAGLTLLTFSDASGGGVSVRSFIMSTSET